MVLKLVSIIYRLWCIFSRWNIAGLEDFERYLDTYPQIQTNHASNPDNIYRGIERYTSLLKLLMKIRYGNKRQYQGTNPSSLHFWGDLAKEHIQYIRNHTFNGINTLKYDSMMPCEVKHKTLYSNYWFSSSDGHTVQEFTDLISAKCYAWKRTWVVYRLSAFFEWICRWTWCCLV